MYGMRETRYRMQRPNQGNLRLESKAPPFPLYPPSVIVLESGHPHLLNLLSATSAAHPRFEILSFEFDLRLLACPEPSHEHHRKSPLQ